MMVYRNNLLKISLLFVLLVTVLSGCGQPTVTVAPTVAPTSTPEAVAPTAEPTVEPTATSVSTEAADRLVLATTTSTQDSGLLPDFKAKTGIDLQVVAVGSGQAMEAGRNGDADVLLVHSPKAEEQFVADGYGVDRTAVMHNDYVLIGPAADPAGVKGMTDTVAAFAKIAAAGATFISRGDNSGTHTKELSIWSKATISPTSQSWYISAGQGMGAVLQMAEEKEAYTLSDRGTYMARTAEGYSLPILLEGDKTLFNPYHVIAVNPEKYPDINYKGAKAFIDWIVSPETQALIAAFTEPKSGKPLFYPDAVTTEGESPAAAPAGLKLTGAVEQAQDWSEEQVKALPTMEAQAANSQGEMKTYTGVSVKALLELVKVKSGATTLVFKADDGYTVEAPLADVLACADCIVSFRNQGGFSLVMPNFPKNLQVKGLVEIEVK